MTKDRLTWHSDWYLRDECYTKMLAEIVNYRHHRHPFTAHWGDGTTSSSDGQRFPVGGPRSHTAQINGKYGPEPGLVFYTHISYQMDPYHTKAITGTPHQPPSDRWTALPRNRSHYPGTLCRYGWLYRSGIWIVSFTGLSFCSPATRLGGPKTVQY